MTIVHRLYTNIAAPERFTNPFCYEPHPLCQLAAEEVKRELEGMQLTEGKMFGVLVVASAEGIGFLAAYSGLLEGRNDWPYFVPPVFDAQQPDGYFKQTERKISALNQQMAESQTEAEEDQASSPLSLQRKMMSERLQIWLFHQYQFLNAKGETKDLIDVWQDYHSSTRIRRKYPLPPGGTGDCCAPKLLQYAYSQQLKPLCMAEFWWGPSPKSEIRHHGEFYPACRGKCKPVLTWMLQGLDVATDAETVGDSHLEPEVVWEDEAIAVLNKPAGMLSAPGKISHYSVATGAEERWPESMIAHRLDMGTSGIMLVAKTMEAYLLLQEQFANHQVKKKYLAIVEGVPEKEHGVIDLPLFSDPMNRPRQTVDYEHGKRAITEFRVLQSSQEKRSLLALWPHTGRAHQLRMHCAHKDGLGCPIVGDELYGRKADRLYLQAQAITFVHPTTEKRMHFDLPYPFEHMIPFQY